MRLQLSIHLRTTFILNRIRFSVLINYYNRLRIQILNSLSRSTIQILNSQKYSSGHQHHHIAYERFPKHFKPISQSSCISFDLSIRSVLPDSVRFPHFVMKFTMEIQNYSSSMIFMFVLRVRSISTFLYSTRKLSVCKYSNRFYNISQNIPFTNRFQNIFIFLEYTIFQNKPIYNRVQTFTVVFDQSWKPWSPMKPRRKPFSYSPPPFSYSPLHGYFMMPRLYMAGTSLLTRAPNARSNQPMHPNSASSPSPSLYSLALFRCSLELLSASWFTWRFFFSAS